MDGVEFLRRVADLGFRGAVVLMSGEDPQVLRVSEGLARARNLTVLGALEKPVRLPQLVTLLGGWQRTSVAPDVKSPRGIAGADLRKALERNEVLPVYQPQVNVATGRIVGVEALARWSSATHGAVAPDVFIPIAEQHGLIDQLTEQMMAAVLRQMRLWTAEGLALRASVNVSMLSLRRLDFPDRLLAQVDASGVPADTLTLEVTEGRVMEDALTCVDSLVRLRLRKLSLSIDDFGTRYASLSQLRALPFNELKVDRSFVHEFATDATGRAILESSIALGRSLGMIVVAEGVEDLDDWNRIARLGCHLAQGYFVSRPLTGPQIPCWIAGWRAPAPA
jgi:EAL domain-containing protein (putative c-di-GMP-specific phosphodiesterase class I)